MRATLTAGRSVTVTSGDTTLFRYDFGAPRPHATELRTRAGVAVRGTIAWSPPHAEPGAATHRALTELSATTSTATIGHRLRWPAVDEWRSLTAVLTGDDTWLLLFENTVTNVSGRALPLAGPSLSLRVVAAPSAARSEWQAARLAGGTVVVVDDSANLAHPPRWSAGLSPAPFDTGTRTLRSDQTIAFRYAVIIAPASHDARRAPRLAALGRDALAGIPVAVRGGLCHGEHTRHGPVRRTRTPVLTRQCTGGALSS
ncbi:hypothetical protein [Actinoplanes sp. NPDC020271]|uniref:hypothetical protein n=1 Tax=Actinoplanes sp. NPDC020271 TaxID=3363896 RepID=UPI0037AE5933